MTSYFNAPMINKVIIVGIVVSTPRICSTNVNKIKVTNFRIACSKKFRTKNGVLKEEVCYISVTAWLKLAEICEKNLVQGDKVYVEGSLQSKQLSDSKMTVVEILADRIQILTPKKIFSCIDKNEDLEKEEVVESESEIVVNEECHEEGHNE
jgi:single-strand DNA-binding protein